MNLLIYRFNNSSMSLLMSLFESASAFLQLSVYIQFYPDDCVTFNDHSFNWITRYNISVQLMLPLYYRSHIIAPWCSLIYCHQTSFFIATCLSITSTRFTVIIIWWLFQQLSPARGFHCDACFINDDEPDKLLIAY